MHLDHVPNDEMDLLISAVNQANLGWKASTCKLQKSHKDYGKDQICEDENALSLTDHSASLKEPALGPIHPESMLV